MRWMEFELEFTTCAYVVDTGRTFIMSVAFGSGAVYDVGCMMYDQRRGKVGHSRAWRLGIDDL